MHYAALYVVFNPASEWLLTQKVQTVGFVVHRLFFHPLAKYPGPWLAKVSNLYAGYHAWKGDLHLDMWKCHEKYGEYIPIPPELFPILIRPFQIGDFVRYGPNSLLVNTATGLHGELDILSDQQASNFLFVP